MRVCVCVCKDACKASAFIVIPRMCVCVCERERGQEREEEIVGQRLLEDVNKNRLWSIIMSDQNIKCIPASGIPLIGALGSLL